MAQDSGARARFRSQATATDMSSHADRHFDLERHTM